MNDRYYIYNKYLDNPQNGKIIYKRIANALESVLYLPGVSDGFKENNPLGKLKEIEDINSFREIDFLEIFKL